MGKEGRRFLPNLKKLGSPRLNFNELLQLFREGNKVKQIIQNLLIITDADERIEENWIYDNMEIKNMIITSQLDEISEFSVVLRNY